MLVVCHKLGGARGGVRPSHCQNIFIKKQKRNKLETQKQKNKETY